MNISGVYREPPFEVNRADWTPQEIPGAVPEFRPLGINKNTPGLILQKEWRILRIDRRFTPAAWVDPLKKDGFILESLVRGDISPSGLCLPVATILQ